MVIPSISVYKTPMEPELPKNKVNWTPYLKRAVLLIHDMQEYFLDAYSDKKSPKVELISNIKVIRERCKELGIPVVYIA